MNFKPLLSFKEGHYELHIIEGECRLNALILERAALQVIVCDVEAAEEPSLLIDWFEWALEHKPWLTDSAYSFIPTTMPGHPALRKEPCYEHLH